jgi:hypothetical protein
MAWVLWWAIASETVIDHLLEVLQEADSGA